MDSTTSRALLAAAAAMLLAAMLAAGLTHPIQNLNEGLYARVAEEMLERGSWIVPTLDGVPYLEKPPLMYWVTALGFVLFGVSDWSARLASILGSVLMLAAVYAFALRRLGRRAAFFAVAILASCPLFIGLERTLLFDALFAGLLAASLVALHEALVEGRARPWLRASAILLALAVLTKGLAALLFYAAIAGAVVAAAPRAERRMRLRRLADPWAWALFAAVAVPWHALAWLQQPSFGWFYFVNEHAMRFLGRRVPRDFHTGPAWYYLPRIAAYAAPWIALLFLPRRRDARPAGVLRGFLAAWILVPLAIFSASGAKGDYYMIVGLPPLALVLAQRAAALRDERALALVPLGWLLLLAALAAVPSIAHRPLQIPAAAPWLIGLAAACAAGALAAALRRETLLAVTASAAVALPLAMLYSGYLRANEDARSARRLAEEIVKRDLRGVYTFRDYEKVSALGYYLRRPIGVIDSHSMDLWFGASLAPDPAKFPSLDRFARSLSGSPLAVVVLDSALRDFRASPLAQELAPLGRFGEAHLFAWVPAQRLAAPGSRGH